MKAIVTQPKNAQSIIILSKNDPEKANLMLKTVCLAVSDTGQMIEDKRVGFFRGSKEQIEQFVKQFNLKNGSEFPLPVRIVVKEFSTPQFDGHEAKINPKTGEVITHNGSSIYRSTIVVAENSPEQDVKLATDREEVQTSKATVGTLQDQLDA